jgi:hypothetical protein
VAILSAIPKRLELLVYRTMYDDLKNLISVNQHGFIKNRSTVTNLLEYASFVLSSNEQRWQVDSVNRNFLKAFSRVRHQLLTVTGGDVCGNRTRSMISLLRSYLTGKICCFQGYQGVCHNT